ncbi:MAG: helix-turn-helix transcriptional regulator [Acidimicrobiaceae bacterium]|nr:helix-turn-helix transcriptional regulator [Acidimicrobiaceae bacterium]MBO0748751.1 helix-turn-helix transcriptional regulator [Acidimicrobiaceae bacterium]
MNEGSEKELISVAASDELCCVPITDAPLSETEAAELAQALAALADPVRLRLLSLLATRSEVCSCDLEGPLGRSQPTVSHHTKVLTEAGLIAGEKRGRWMWWRIDHDRLAAIRKALGG